MNRPIHAYTCQCGDCCSRVYRVSLKAQEKPKKIYLIGSMRNKNIPVLAAGLRHEGFEVFDDWHSSGEHADDCWQRYEKIRGRSYKEALRGHHAKTAFNMDKTHLEASDIGVLVMPAGKSGHLELGYMLGAGKPAFILFDKEPERFDLMYQFATGICFSEAELMEELNVFAPKRISPAPKSQEAREQDTRNKEWADTAAAGGLDLNCQCGSRCRELANCRYRHDTGREG